MSNEEDKIFSENEEGSLLMNADGPDRKTRNNGNKRGGKIKKRKKENDRNT